MGLGSSKFDASEIEDAKKLNKYVERMQKLMKQIGEIKAQVGYTTGQNGAPGQFSQFNKINLRKKKKLDQLENELYSLIELMEATKTRLTKIGSGLGTLKRAVGKEASDHAQFAENYHAEKGKQFSKLKKNMQSELAGDYTRALTNAFTTHMQRAAQTAQVSVGPTTTASYKSANKKKLPSKKKSTTKKR